MTPNASGFTASAASADRSAPDEYAAHTDPGAPDASPAARLAAALEAHGAGRLDEAQAIYSELVERDPAHADALHYWGVVCHQRGDHRGALALMDRALEHARADAVCWSNRGLAALALGQHAEAAHNLREALRLAPGFADAHSNLALALREAGDYAGAERHCRAALALAPASVNALVNLGSVLAKLQRYEQALASYREALALAPADAAIHFNLANAQRALGDDAAAIAHYRQAVELAPGYAAAWVNLGTALGQTGDYRAAETCYRKAVELEPNAANLVCLGASLGAQGRNEEEEPYYRRALELDPEHADARQNLVWLKLKRGEYREGWAEYARRWRACDYAPFDIEGMAEWQGEPLEGKRVLLVHEQGFGDQIQFVRYASTLAARGASVDVCVPQTLQLLAQSVPGVHRAWTGTPAGDYDYWLYVMSAPSACGTELDTVPATVPYLFAREVDIQAWKPRVQAAMAADLARQAGKEPDNAPLAALEAAATSVSKAGEKTAVRKPAGYRNIGLVWGGNPGFYNDRNRSVALAAFRPLFALEKISWFSLQKGEAARAQLAALAGDAAIHDFTDDLRDFGDTAALIMNLDLVIAVDTSVAHLAGALGKPVWILVPANGEWRWLEKRADSPWYPTARLFRQREVGDWQTALGELCEALTEKPKRAGARKSAPKSHVAAQQPAHEATPQATQQPAQKATQRAAQKVASEAPGQAGNGELDLSPDRP
ncbi:tetratricopeptide repeat protein [Paraburkholderia silviterrae]|uniref:Tetratricopeptide repeat protein n=1 Tax=Paraburkholderia silviterrae TaxID=2528715 RepID=A0A4R5LXQ1_9BURK|nr:tetratricopeptide repeat protein [Paraburkholderia silviterrae]TDG16762.1 tetratricopeptide repeat protein [Paraburkholderia silviterrae]